MEEGEDEDTRGENNIGDKAVQVDREGEARDGGKKDLEGRTHNIENANAPNANSEFLLLLN